MTKVIAYVPHDYADILCPGCTAELGFDIKSEDLGACTDDCESDAPHFCGNCSVFLGGSLTNEGERYTIETFSDNPEIRDFYRYLPWPGDDDA